MMKVDGAGESGAGVIEVERRVARRARVIGRLISLNGKHGVIACGTWGDIPEEHWWIGDLISVINERSRLVGLVCELATVDRFWREQSLNQTVVKIELAGEIIEEEPGKPVFHRGIRSFPKLGAFAPPHSRQRSARDLLPSRRGRRRDWPADAERRLPPSVSIDELTRRHFAVVGSTGVGKSTAVAMLLKQCIRHRPDLRVLIADPHNEYARHFAFEAVLLDADSLELPYWMFRFDEIAEIIFAGRKTNADELEALYEVIRAAKLRYNSSAAGRPAENTVRRQLAPESSWITADTPVPYRISEALQIIDEWKGKLDPRYARADLRLLRNRLVALSRDPRYRFMFGNVIVEDILARVVGHIFRLPKAGPPVTIVQMAGLPNEVVNSVVSVLSRMAFEVALWSRGAYRIAVVCEEAHRYIPADPAQGFRADPASDQPHRQGGTQIRRFARCRDPAPSDLDPTVLSQCSTMFAMRLGNERDKDIITEASGVSAEGAVSFLSSIADREAIAFGEAIATPMRMKFGDYREFEAERALWSEGPCEDLIQARAALKTIVARLRNEIPPATAA